MGSVSLYELDIQGTAPGVLRDPAALAKIVEEFNARPVIDTRQSSRASPRKTLNKDTTGEW